jgi:hypothetical protein
MCHALRVRELQDLEHWLSVQWQMHDRLRDDGLAQAASAVGPGATGAALVMDLVRSTAGLGLEHLKTIRELLDEELARDAVVPWYPTTEDTDEACYVLGTD